ncbi:MAG: Fic family protein [Candidatus Vogelbacteria bacterium]|nr:Fic family protein [Candidatus Vogelbacteria bacterium]
MIRRELLLNFIRKCGRAASSEIHDHIVKSGEKTSLITVKRVLSQLDHEGVLSVSGKGRATTYALSEYGKLTSDVDAALYCSIPPDERYGSSGYNFNLFDALNFNPFSESEQDRLKQATNFYQSRAAGASEPIRKRELERFIIELSWKSSRIEGNTYTLLDTEALILRDVEATGHSQAEATMILNHKKAFTFIYEHQEKFKTLTRSNVEDVHKLLVQDLGVRHNLRSQAVGVIGSLYRPLDNEYQIREALEKLSAAISRFRNGYAKAFFALLGLSYLQPFEDGNKRTARLMTNAVLLAHDLAPLSYRSVEEKSYREAIIVFYELNALSPIKKIFVEQYDFAARNYLLSF